MNTFTLYNAFSLIGAVVTCFQNSELEEENKEILISCAFVFESSCNFITFIAIPKVATHVSKITDDLQL